MFPVATRPITLLAKPPPLLTEEVKAFPPRPPLPLPVAFLTALLEKLRLTTPARPPFIKPPPPPPEDAPFPPVPPALPANCFAIKAPLVAMRASAIIEPPVCPTLIPSPARKLSIFWLTFKKAIAQRNQTKIFPVTASLP